MTGTVTVSVMVTANIRLVSDDPASEMVKRYTAPVCVHATSTRFDDSSFPARQPSFWVQASETVELRRWRSGVLSFSAAESASERANARACSWANDDVSGAGSAIAISSASPSMICREPDGAAAWRSACSYGLLCGAGSVKVSESESGTSSWSSSTCYRHWSREPRPEPVRARPQAPRVWAYSSTTRACPP